MTTLCIFCQGDPCIVSEDSLKIDPSFSELGSLFFFIACDSVLSKGLCVHLVWVVLIQYCYEYNAVVF